jgi:DNA-directed RNA polymerase specialized sigma subunit
MKYTKEVTDRLIAEYERETPTEEIAKLLDVPERSVIAKLSSLGVYKKKTYLNKRGEVPIKKSEHIERIAQLLEVNSEILESLEKVNKTVLQLLEQRLQDPKPQ